ncbi:MAG TPA: DUF922 domain-containing protein [Dehalococcoidia bacterium]|nr:DUF922 domain-containing protein [Dehalococcoidia bacterium]
MPGIAVVLALVLTACGGQQLAPGSNEAPDGPGTAGPVTRSPGSALESATSTAGERVRLSVSQSTTTYPVYGSTGDEVLAYIERFGPLDEDGQRASGVTNYSSRLDWRPGGNPRACAIASMTIEVDLRVLLPALDASAPVPADVRSRWAVFAAGVASHEQRHVDIYLAGVQRIKERMLAIPPASSCTALEAQVNEVWEGEQRALDEEQERFHAEERRRVEGLRAPIRAQIEAARARLQSLGDQISGVDSSLSSLSAQLSALRDLLAGLTSQLQAIESRYQGEALPSDVYQQYQALRGQYNALIPGYNTLVDNYNSLLGTRAELVRQAEALQGQLNDLVDEFNWTR